MQDYNIGGDELRIKTKWGDLVVSVGHDSEYPEYYVVLEMEESDFTLACIGQDKDCLKVRIKDGDIGYEDLYPACEYYDEEIMEAYNERINYE